MGAPKGQDLEEPALEEGRSIYKHIILENTRLKEEERDQGAQQY